jgi:two-component system response regulator (stage 0 sporulation protein A)
MGQDKIVQRALALGAEYYFIKPFDISLLVERIKQLLSKGMPANDSISPNYSSSKLPQTDLKKDITDILHKVGIPPNIKGYQFLREALILSVNDFKILDAVTTELYPAIAGMHNTTANRVERAMRHAIEVAWTRGSIDEIFNYFGNTINLEKSKPTNSQFIAMISDRLRLSRCS